MRSFLSRNLKLLIPIGVVLTAAAVYLAFFVFGIQTLVIDDKVDEAGPVFDSGAAAEVRDDLPAAPVGTDDPPAAPAVSEEAPAAPAASEEAPAATVPEVRTLVSGTFVDRSHPATGTAAVLGDGTGQRFLRFEDFATDNGPDLNVYLSAAPADADAGEFDDDFVDLGDLVGNIGNQNYEIPADVDLERYSTVVIWCVRFGVAFGAADLT